MTYILVVEQDNDFKIYRAETEAGIRDLQGRILMHRIIEYAGDIDDEEWKPVHQEICLKIDAFHQSNNYAGLYDYYLNTHPGPQMIVPKHNTEFSVRKLDAIPDHFDLVSCERFWRETRQELAPSHNFKE